MTKNKAEFWSSERGVKLSTPQKPSKFIYSAKKRKYVKNSGGGRVSNNLHPVFTPFIMLVNPTKGSKLRLGGWLP